MLRSLALQKVARRVYSTQVAGDTREAWLFVDSVFPIQIARWDFRHYIGILRQEHLLSSLQERLDKLSVVHNFKALELDPQQKDGGVFVRFSYTPQEDPDLDEDKHLETLQTELRQELAKHPPIATWVGINTASLWLVRGIPWREDMSRFASPILKLAFDGPDIQEQSLYDLCRPYGQIKDLTPPAAVPAGTLRSATVQYHKLHASTIARNVIHGLDVPVSSGKTRIRAQYILPMEAHAFRDWVSNHPRITLPILFFLLGTLTYTIFDPIRSVMVEAKMLDWFDYRKFRLYQWIRSNTLDRLSSTFGVSQSTSAVPKAEDVWKERKDAEANVKAYLADMPTTIAFVHGPQGSGKSTMLKAILEEAGRNNLVIDVRELNNAPSDMHLIGSLAGQTGYWPVFTFLNSMNNLIDLASVGLIGQKAGLSTSFPDQLKQVLDVVTSGLKAVSSSHRSAIQRAIQREEKARVHQAEDARKRKAIREGTWHDGRLDCIAGNGVMSELGMGDERWGDDVKILVPEEHLDDKPTAGQEESIRRQKTQEDVDAINSLPIVVVRNFASTTGSATKEEMLKVLAEWAASLAEGGIAHVIVLSDNRENAKRLAKALPSKPLTQIALSDADASSSLSFVKEKLHDSGHDVVLSAQEGKSVERLGGRASDLESLIHKVRSGMKVDEAVEDIINRGVGELRKNAFGDDADDAKSLPWTREQAWRVLKLLSKSGEVGYHETLIEFPFKGDESALRSMEHAELIAIGTKDGRASTIRAGKPVFRYVFERVVNDRVFEATQELAYNEKQIAEAEGKIKGYESELAVLVDTMSKEGRRWWQLGHSACRERARHIGEKLVIAERKVDSLERKNREWKRVLSRGE